MILVGYSDWLVSDNNAIYQNVTHFAGCKSSSMMTCASFNWSPSGTRMDISVVNPDLQLRKWWSRPSSTSSACDVQFLWVGKGWTLVSCCLLIFLLRPSLHVIVVLLLLATGETWVQREALEDRTAREGITRPCTLTVCSMSEMTTDVDVFPQTASCSHWLNCLDSSNYVELWEYYQIYPNLY